MPMFAVTGKPWFTFWVNSMTRCRAANLARSLATRGSGEASSTTTTRAHAGKSAVTESGQAKCIFQTAIDRDYHVYLPLPEAACYRTADQCAGTETNDRSLDAARAR